MPSSVKYTVSVCRVARNRHARLHRALENGEYATILTIREHMCKWPIGDPSKDNFRFCGRKTDPSTPYCDAHSAVAYQPSRRRYPGQKSLEEQKRRLLSQKLSGQK